MNSSRMHLLIRVLEHLGRRIGPIACDDFPPPPPPPFEGEIIGTPLVDSTRIRQTFDALEGR